MFCSGGIEIIELPSPDERSKPDGTHKMEPKEYHVSELPNDTDRLTVREVKKSGVTGENIATFDMVDESIAMCTCI